MKKSFKFRFDLRSFVIFLIIFITEVLIALYLNDPVIRPYIGDILVVILMYYFVKSFIKTRTIYLVAGVLIFAYLVEISQYLRLIDLIGMRDHVLVRTVLGSHFTWIDMLAYTVGAAICYFIDRKETT